MEYAELGWQEAVVVGCAKQERILEAVADGNSSADDVASSKSIEGLFLIGHIRTTPGAWSCTGSS